MKIACRAHAFPRRDNRSPSRERKNYLEQKKCSEGWRSRAFGGLPWRSAKAQAANTIKLAVPVDMSGMYRDVTGSTSIVAARQAV